MKKIFYFTSLIIFLILAVSFYTIVNKGYDRQNKFILSIKEIIPSKFAREVRSTIFAIPNLKKKNELLTFQVKKYEQGMEGELFKEQNILSKNKKNYNIKEFYLPFKRLDLNLGWKATENSRRAHYLELVDDKVLAISGLSQTIYFLKKILTKKNLIKKILKIIF